MSEYEYTYPTSSGPDLTIGSFEGMAAHIWISSNYQPGGIGSYIPNADAPIIAAELLKAAGQDALAHLLTDVLEKHQAALKKAAEKKLQERRDALAAELPCRESSTPIRYSEARASLQDAIDRIIELENATPRD